MKLICSITGHVRSAREARFDYSAQRWRSVCRHCSEPMIRHRDGGWSAASEAPLSPA